MVQRIEWMIPWQTVSDQFNLVSAVSALSETDSRRRTFQAIQLPLATKYLDSRPSATDDPNKPNPYLWDQRRDLESFWRKTSPTSLKMSSCLTLKRYKNNSISVKEKDSLDSESVLSLDLANKRINNKNCLFAFQYSTDDDEWAIKVIY